MRRGVILLFLSLGVFLLDRGGQFNWLKSPILKKIRPIQLQLRKSDIQEVTNTSEIFNLVDKAELSRLKKENERLRELLGTKISPAWKFIPAKIIKDEGDSLVIDVGSELGVSTEMVVIGLARDQVNNGVLLGGIEKVTNMQATVRLLNNLDSDLDVKTESGSVGVIEGDGEKYFLKQVLQKQGLTEGEMIVSKGGDGWPGNLVVGLVGEVERVDTKVYMEAEVIELIKAGSLEQVFVVSF